MTMQPILLAFLVLIVGGAEESRCLETPVSSDFQKEQFVIQSDWGMRDAEQGLLRSGFHLRHDRLARRGDSSAGSRQNNQSFAKGAASCSAFESAHGRFLRKSFTLYGFFQFYGVVRPHLLFAILRN